MKTEQFLKAGLTEEQAKKAMDFFKEEQKKFIPKVRFDQLNEKKKNLEKLVMFQQALLEQEHEANVQSKILSEQAGHIWEYFIASNRKLEELLREFLIQSAIKAELTGSSNSELILEQIDKSKLTLTNQGEVLGLEKQIMDIQTKYQKGF